MAKRPNMQVVGAKIAHLRREKGLCVAAFAREIEQPAWLIMLLESAHMEQSKQLIDLLPDSVIEELLREIREAYGVSHRWLTTRYQSPKHPALSADESCPLPLLLPVAISPEDAMACLDDLMALTMPDPRCLLQHETFFLQCIKNVALLHQLHLAQLRQCGHDALADQHRQQFKQLLDQRFSHWMKELNITDLYLNESTSA